MLQHEEVLLNNIFSPVSLSFSTHPSYNELICANVLLACRSLYKQYLHLPHVLMQKVNCWQIMSDTKSHHFSISSCQQVHRVQQKQMKVIFRIQQAFILKVMEQGDILVNCSTSYISPQVFNFVHRATCYDTFLIQPLCFWHPPGCLSPIISPDTWWNRVSCACIENCAWLILIWALQTCNHPWNYSHNTCTQLLNLVLFAL